jgi:signal transduction histidine kinase
MSRLLQLDTFAWLRDHISVSGLDRRWRNAAMGLAVSSVVALGVFDVVTDTQFSHGIVYVLPVVAVTILTSSRRGLALAALSATTWVIADLLTAQHPHEESLPGALGDEVLRMLAFGAVVVVLATMRDALAEAKAADLRMREFLREAAHQLRTPVASLRACADTLIMSGVNEEQERLLSIVATESQRIGRLTNSLVQMARLDQGERGATRPVDLAALCRTEVEVTRHRTGGSIDVTIKADLGGRPFVVIDPDATREALANLLDNARRHAVGRIEVIARFVGDEVEIAVGDDGPGLPVGDEGRAFGRFVTLDGKGGSGLGLPIARAYIERQGGHLFYDHGRFVIRLPANGPRENPSASGLPEPRNLHRDRRRHSRASRPSQ